MEIGQVDYDRKDNYLHVNTQKKLNLVNICVLFACFIFIFLGMAISQYFIIFVALVMSVYVIVMPLNISLAAFIGLLPFSEIMYANGINMFYLIMFFIMVKMILNSKLTLKSILSMCLFIIYYAVTLELNEMDTFSYAFVLMNIVAAIMLLAYRAEINKVEVVKLFTIGFILSIIMGMFAHNIPYLASLLRLTFIDGKPRFMGLAWDTNFFAAQALLVIAMCMTMYYRCRTQRLFYIISAGIAAIFGVLTMSKMFLLGLVLLFLMWLCFSHEKRILKAFVVIAIGIVGIVVISIMPNDSSIILMLKRVGEIFTGEVNLNQFTTGRFVLWTKYIDLILADVNQFMFGAGANVIPATINKAAHNTYIEVFYAFGLVGTVLLGIAIYYSLICVRANRFNRRKTSLYSFATLLIILFSFVGLSGMTGISFVFGLSIAVLMICDKSAIIENKKKKKIARKVLKSIPIAEPNDNAITNVGE